jgi:hypothetical protein
MMIVEVRFGLGGALFMKESFEVGEQPEKMTEIVVVSCGVNKRGGLNGQAPHRAARQAFSVSQSLF